MRTRSKKAWLFGCGAALCTILAGQLAWGSMDYGSLPTGLAKDVMSDDPAVAKAAADGLRAMGPDGLGVLMSVYERDVRRHTGRRHIAHLTFTAEVFESACREPTLADSGPRSATRGRSPVAPANPGHADAWARLAAAIDAVAAQKDAAYSGLYWHTDLERAKAAARKSGKPILSLRLLGTLDTEFSCANSRFFRTVLYANNEVSAALRDRFVLHWQSVRPVPKVMIDMGDGRVVHRTITGNSVHYVLDAEGRPVDAVPGLYGPKAFLRAIDAAGQAARAAGEMADRPSRLAMLKDWHGERAGRLTSAWEQDLAAVGVAPVVVGTLWTAENAPGVFPTAARAARAAVGKSMVELNIVRALAPRVAVLRASTTDDAWAKLAALPAHAEAARLDDASRALVAAKHPPARAAGRNALSKMKVEDPIVRVLANLERSVAEDTVRNEYGFHRMVHEWFAASLKETIADDVGPLNEKIYAELFLTPSSDPWLGLVPAHTYSALEGDGMQRGATE